MVVRPGTLLNRRDVLSLLDRLREVPFRGRLPVSPEDVEQLLVFWESGAGRMAERAAARLVSPPSGLVVRMSKPQDWKAVIAKLVEPAF